MAKCPKCGAAVEDGSKFCDECGAAIPQTKVCPKCHAQLKPNAKFCSECGYSFAGKPSDAGGISMGDKNVVAGDVVGKKEDYHVSGNATFVTNQDETKKMVRCHICGKNIAIAGAFTCPTCGEIACEDCYDKDAGTCVNCAQKESSKKETQYRDLLARVYADGKVELAERKQLDALREQLHLADDRAAAIEQEFRGKTKPVATSLTRTEEASLTAAEEALYAELDAAKALKDSEGVYLRHKDNERALSIYLASLMMVDRNRAAETIKSLSVDFESAYATSFDLAMMTGDYLKAEQVMQIAANLWPESEAFKFRRIEFQCSLYYEHKDNEALDEAERAVVELEEGDGKIANSWRYYLMRLVSMFRGDYIPYSHCDRKYDDEDFVGNVMYDALAHGRVGCFMSVDIRKIYEARFNRLKFLELNKTPIVPSEYRAVSYLSTQKDPISLIIAGDCLLATDETDNWFGLKNDAETAVSNYREAASIMVELIGDSSEEYAAKLPAQYSTGIGDDGYGFRDNCIAAVAFTRVALCLKDGIGGTRDRAIAGGYWEDFLEKCDIRWQCEIKKELSASCEIESIVKENIKDLSKCSLKI